MSFTLTVEQLKQTWKKNSFQVSGKQMVFFGFRGCLPVQDDDHSFREEHQLELVQPDYIHPRCTLGQWDPSSGFAIFPGSTIPHQRYVKGAMEKNGSGANQLMTGLYNDYRKGMHKAGKSTGHEAFRQVNSLPIRRTADDLDYDEEISS